MYKAQMLQNEVSNLRLLVHLQKFISSYSVIRNRRCYKVINGQKVLNDLTVPLREVRNYGRNGRGPVTV